METTHAAARSDVIGAVWTQQDRNLWTGRLNGRPAGTIERGRRYTFICPEGNAYRGHPTLSHAQHAALTAASGSETPRAAEPRGRVLVLTSSAAVAATVSFVLTAAAVLR